MARPGLFLEFSEHDPIIFENSQQPGRIFSGILRKRSDHFLKYPAAEPFFFLHGRTVGAASDVGCDDYSWVWPVPVPGRGVLF
jgi:hypothetical protein